MGNFQSSSGPQRPQHKLSKTRRGHHAPVAGVPDLAIGSNSQHGRFSNSYLISSVPISPTSTSSVEPESPGIGIALGGDEFENRMAPGPRSATRRDSRRSSVASRTQSFQSEQSRRRSSIVGPRPRPDSLNIDGSPSPHARTESLQSAGRRGSVNFDVRRTYEAQRLLALDRDVITKSPMMAPESHSPVSEVTETTWKSSNPARPSSISITRSNSDVSAYMPMRRRSFVNEPGVATRAQRAGPPSAKSSFHSSQPSTPSRTRHNSIVESDAERHLSALPENFGSEPPERAVTPCEAEYQQLGGMKFGSLRIINGSPARSPRPECTIEMEGELVKARPKFRTSYPGRVAPTSTIMTDTSKSPRKRLFRVLNPS